MIATEALRQKLERGHEVSLILGAGVSIPRGVPNWARLTEASCRHFGVELPADFASRHPLALPIALERAEAAAASRRRKKKGRSFVESLRNEIYAEVKRAVRGDTLDSLATIVREQQRAQPRRLRRVITFNVDDLLESSANAGSNPLSSPVVWPIARESSKIRSARGARGRPPIPVYHVHGFLPQSGTPLAKHEAADALVFTEAQYWASFAEPTSFPNRVLLGALHDSVCVFVGLSMTDLNIARWLGVRANAITRDRERVRSGARPSSPKAALDHHFWIRKTPAPDSAEAYVTPLIRTRGVQPIDLTNWNDLSPLLKSLFSAGRKR